jgi:hypothetical protein
MCCGSGVSIIRVYNNGLYQCFVYEVNLLFCILLFCHCSCNVTYCWCAGFPLVLCVAVTNVACILFCFYIVGNVCVLLIGVQSLQCSKYLVMCINICVSCVSYF